MKQPTRLEQCVHTWMGAGAGTVVAMAARAAHSALQSTIATSESTRAMAGDCGTRVRTRIRKGGVRARAMAGDGARTNRSGRGRSRDRQCERRRLWPRSRRSSMAAVSAVVQGGDRVAAAPGPDGASADARGRGHLGRWRRSRRSSTEGIRARDRSRAGRGSGRGRSRPGRGSGAGIDHGAHADAIGKGEGIALAQAHGVGRQADETKAAPKKNVPVLVFLVV